MRNYSVNFLPEGVSDHSPIHVVMKSNMTLKRKAFKYCNTMSKHPQFSRTLEEVWSQRRLGCTIFQVIRKLKEFKKIGGNE